MAPLRGRPCKRGLPWFCVPKFLREACPGFGFVHHHHHHHHNHHHHHHHHHHHNHHHHHHHHHHHLNLCWCLLRPCITFSDDHSVDGSLDSCCRMTNRWTEVRTAVVEQPTSSYGYACCNLALPQNAEAELSSEVSWSWWSRAFWVTNR